MVVRKRDGVLFKHFLDELLHVFKDNFTLSGRISKKGRAPQRKRAVDYPSHSPPIVFGTLSFIWEFRIPLKKFVEPQHQLLNSSPGINLPCEWTLHRRPL